MSEWRYFAAWGVSRSAEVIKVPARASPEATARRRRAFERYGLKVAGPFEDRDEALSIATTMKAAGLRMRRKRGAVDLLLPGAARPVSDRDDWR